jgi:hypothetical protein
MKAHLFLCVDNGHYAFTREDDGGNLPIKECAGGWHFIRSLDIEVDRPLPLSAAPEPIIRALSDDGYYIFGSDAPHGTSQ